MTYISMLVSLNYIRIHVEKFKYFYVKQTAQYQSVVSSSILSLQIIVSILLITKTWWIYARLYCKHIFDEWRGSMISRLVKIKSIRDLMIWKRLDSRIDKKYPWFMRYKIFHRRPIFFNYTEKCTVFNIFNNCWIMLISFCKHFFAVGLKFSKKIVFRLIEPLF